MLIFFISFEKNIWGDQARKDSLDSISRLSGKQLKTMRAANRRASKSTTPSVRSNRRASSGSSSSSGGQARVTVRRQRH